MRPRPAMFDFLRLWAVWLLALRCSIALLAGAESTGSPNVQLVPQPVFDQTAVSAKSASTTLIPTNSSATEKKLEPPQYAQQEEDAQQPQPQQRLSEHVHVVESKPILQEEEEEDDDSLPPPSHATLLSENDLVPKRDNRVLVLSPTQGIRWARVLALHSGFTNALFLSGSLGTPKLTVVAVTGAWTNSAVGAAKGQWSLFVTPTAVIMSYILGSMVYGFISASSKRLEPWHLDRATVATVLQAMSLCFVAALALIRPWGSHEPSPSRHLAAFCLAALASGVQNSLTSVQSANLCRTTHYSGMSSDMGTFLGQCLGGHTANLPKLQTFASLTASFWIGGASAMLLVRLGSLRHHASHNLLWVSVVVPLLLSLAVWKVDNKTENVQAQQTQG